MELPLSAPLSEPLPVPARPLSLAGSPCGARPAHFGIETLVKFDALKYGSTVRSCSDLLDVIGRPHPEFDPVFSKSEAAQSGMVERPRAERPVILSLFFLNRQIIDAGMARRHHRAGPVPAGPRPQRPRPQGRQRRKRSSCRPARSCQARDLARQLASDTGRVSRTRGNASVMGAGSLHDQADAHELLR